MAEMNSILNSYAGALALLALVVLLGFIVLMAVQMNKQKKALEKLQAEQDKNAREALRQDSFLQMSEMHTQRLTQAMDQRSQDEALRLQAVSQQLESISAGQEQRLQHMQRQLDEKLNQNEERMERMRETLHKSVNQLQEENSKKLEEMRITVDEKLHATLDKRLGESFQQVSQRLEMVYKGLGEMQTLASGVGDLKRVLTNVKTRGVWGEMQLGNLLSQVLSPNQYDENVAVVPGSSQRVEYAVKLPGQGDHTVYLPIDSKFPLEDYERLLSAYDTADPEAVAAATAALQTALKTEAKRISSKYIQPPHTTDFAVMFLPIEGLYAEALRIRGLAEQLQQQNRIIVAGPTTLGALLTSLQVGFRTLAIEKRTDEVWQLLSAVKTEFGNFSRILDATQKKLHAASESIESASRKSRTIERKLRKVEALEDVDSGAHLPEDEYSDLPLLNLPDDSSASSALD